MSVTRTGLPSQHYIGERGHEYYESKFNSRMQFGRLWQLRYFEPYCGTQFDLLDFGCSDGLSLRILPAHRRIAVEANPSARDNCVRLATEQGIDIEVHASLEEVADNSADVAISNHCLEHVPRPYDAIAELYRIVKPGGTLILVTPIDDWRDHKNHSWKKADCDNHLYTWSPMNLGNLVSEAGFVPEKIQVCTTAWSPKLFWIHRWFGGRAFALACRVLAAHKNRRELFCLARKSD